MKQYNLNTDKDVMKILDEEGIMKSCNKKARENYIYSRVFCPYYKKNKFNGILALNKDNKIIMPSNSYVIKHHGEKYNDIHEIYNLINFSYDTLTTLEHDVMIPEKCMLFGNAFSGANFGHDMSVVLDLLKYYKQKKLNCKILVLQKSFEIPRMIEFLKLFFRDDQIIVMKLNKIYKVKELIIKQRETFNIYKHKDIIKESLELATKKHMDKKYLNKKIFLVKNDTQGSIIQKDTMYHCPKLMKILENKYKWVVINPEKMTIYEIMLYLANAERIVTSYGGILYAHEIFFNPTAHWLYLDGCRKPYHHHSKYRYIKTGRGRRNLDYKMKDMVKLLTRKY